MENKEVATEETSVLPVTSDKDATTTTAAETPAEPVPDSSEKEGVSVEKETKAPEDTASNSTTTVSTESSTPEQSATAAAEQSTATATTTTTAPASRSSSSRRNSGVSGIANRVHRHETRAGTEGRLPSRFSDYEVGSPRQSQGRATRQRSSDLKKSTTEKESETAAPAGGASESAASEPVASNPAPAVNVPSEPVNNSSTGDKKEVDPADALEMMLMNSGALPVQPPAKKPREDPAIAAAAPTTATVPVDASTSAKKTSGGDKSARKSRSSKRKSLVEGREARVVKRKFSLEQEMGLSDELQKCLGLLNNMFHQDECAPFYYAVDPIRLNIPDYWDVIKRPMDMTKIKENLLNGNYKDAKEFTADVHLMFENARTYNPVGNPVHTLADRLEKNFEEQMAKIHSRRASPSQPAASSTAASSSQTTASRTSSRSNLSSSTKKSRPSSSRAAAAASSESSESSSDSSSSNSDSSDYSDDGHRKQKGRHHGKHHHHHHRHGKKSHGKKRSRSSSSVASELASVEESIRRAELEKLQNEVRLLKSQLAEQKQNKAKAASAARAEKASLAAAKRASKSTPKRPPLSFDSAPDPDRPVTEEDKRRISGNINRLPPERMVPLVSFVQDQIPTLSLVIPGHIPMMPSEIEVDLDTLDNRTLRTVDHKVRQALALAGQARRRAERRLLEMQLHKEQQQRHHAAINVGDQQRVGQAKTTYQPLMLTPQQTAMNYMDTLRRSVGIQRDMSPLSPSGSRGGYATHESSVPGTPGSSHSGVGAENSDIDEDGPEEEEVGENGVVPNLGSDSETSSSSSSSSDSEADDDIPGTFVPPPLAPGSASGPVTLSQATAAAAAASSSTNSTVTPP